MVAESRRSRRKGVRRRGFERQAEQAHQSGKWHIVGQVAALATAVVAIGGLYYTNQNLKVTQQQIVVAQEGQKADRFGKAVELLGSENLDARLGGIHALDHLAHDSSRHHPAVVDVLTAYVRSHAPAPGSCDLPKTRDEPLPAPDVQAAMTAIGHRNVAYDNRTFVNLSRLCFVGVNLDGGDFAGANFSQSTFWRLSAKGANFDRARFEEASMHRVDFTGANLTCVIGQQYYRAESSNFADVVGRIDPDNLEQWPQCH